MTPEVARDVTKSHGRFSTSPVYLVITQVAGAIGFSPHMQHSPLLMRTALLFAAVVQYHSKRTLTCPSGRAIFRFTDQPFGSDIARLLSQQKYLLTSSIYRTS